MKKLLLTVFLIIHMLGHVTSAGAALSWHFQYIDAISVPGDTITYTLTLTEKAPGQTYHADFNINTNSAAKAYYADWFTFKLVPGSTPPLISNFSGTNPWAYADRTNIDVLVKSGKTPKWNNLLEASAVGFYTTNIGKPGINPTTGVLVSTPGITSFHFDFATNSYIPTETIPFKVGYYFQNDKGWQHAPLSKEMTPAQVPIPSALFLFAPGLLGIWGIRRIIV